jgi:hypothetical protein
MFHKTPIILLLHIYIYIPAVHPFSHTLLLQLATKKENAMFIPVAAILGV